MQRAEVPRAVGDAAERLTSPKEPPLVPSRTGHGADQGGYRECATRSTRAFLSSVARLWEPLEGCDARPKRRERKDHRYVLSEPGARERVLQRGAAHPPPSSRTQERPGIRVASDVSPVGYGARRDVRICDEEWGADEPCLVSQPHERAHGRRRSGHRDVPCIDKRGHRTRARSCASAGSVPLRRTTRPPIVLRTQIDGQPRTSLIQPLVGGGRQQGLTARNPPRSARQTGTAHELSARRRPPLRDTSPGRITIIALTPTRLSQRAS